MDEYLEKLNLYRTVGRRQRAHLGTSDSREIIFKPRGEKRIHYMRPLYGNKRAITIHILQDYGRLVDELACLQALRRPEDQDAILKILERMQDLDTLYQAICADGEKIQERNAQLEKEIDERRPEVDKENKREYVQRVLEFQKWCRENTGRVRTMVVETSPNNKNMHVLRRLAPPADATIILQEPSKISV